MGYFKDAFNLGAGATLGNMAVNTGYNIGATFTDAAMKKAYTKYRTKYFDPIVRSDLCDIMVKGSLSQREYPFPRNSCGKRENFFKRHQVFTLLLIGTVITDFLTPFFDFLYTIAATLSFALVIACFGLVFKKIGSGGKKVMEKTYKPRLDEDGAQYWHIREYIRQTLDTRELTVKDAVLKISNTRLAQQFPDTIEEIEANAFYYRQKIGM